MNTRYWQAALLGGVVALCGCEKNAEGDRVPPPRATPAANEKATAVPVPEEDAIADKPSATTPAEPKKALLEGYSFGDRPISRRARRCYEMLAEMRTNVDRVAADLDAGGKEITRLVNTSDDISKNVTEIAQQWPDNRTFIDSCASAKRATLVLNDELSRIPRKWTHVRWSFDEMVKELKTFREKARILADAEPEPILIKNKKGETVYADRDEIVDPVFAKKEAQKREDRQEVERERRAETRRREAKEKVQIDLEGTKGR